MHELYKSDPSCCNDSSGRSILVWAMQNNCHETIQKLSESGHNFDPATVHRELQHAEHQKIGFCEKTNRPVQAWCNTCNMPICDWCMAKRGDHKDHDTDADLNACFLDHKGDFLSCLQKVDEGVQALKDESQEDSKNGRKTINEESDSANAGIGQALAKYANSVDGHDKRDDEEISKLEARIAELKAAKAERQRQREGFDQQAHSTETSVKEDARRHCETVNSWEQKVLAKAEAAAAQATAWRQTITDAQANRQEAHIDMPALTALRARRETQEFLADSENLELPTFPDAVVVATDSAQSACTDFQKTVNDTIADHSQMEEQKTLTFLTGQEASLSSLQAKMKGGPPVSNDRRGSWLSFSK